MIKSKTLAIALAFGFFATSVASAAFTFTKQLGFGMRNSDVVELQERLRSEGTFNYGTSTGYFGSVTKTAVQAFQASKGITKTGYVGPWTLCTLNGGTYAAGVCTAGSTTGGTSTTLPAGCTSTAGFSPTTGVSCATGTTTTVTGPVSVMLATSNPVASYIVAGQAGARLAEFTFSGNGTVTNLTLQKLGLSNNSALDNVYLYDGMTRLTDGNSVRTDGTVSFNAPAGLFTVAGSKTITVRADIATGTSGQTLGFGVMSMNTTGSTTATSVMGVNGNLFSIASTTTANVQFTNQSVSANTGVIIPKMNHSIWNVATTVSTNNVNLKGLTLEMIGSADASALSNVTLYVDGVSVKTTNVMAVNGSKRIMFDLSATPKLLTTGGHNIEVRSDIVSGATRDFQIKLMSLSDIVLEDVIVSNVGISVASVGYQAYKDAGKQTLTGASNTSVNIFKDTSYTTTNITPGASNVVLGKFKLTAYGEDTKVQTVVVTPTISGTNNDTQGVPAAAKPGNIGLYVNGSQVGNTISNNPVTGTWTFNLGSNFIAAAGVENVLEVRGNAMASTTGNAITAGTIMTTLTSASGVGQFSQSSFTNSSAPAGQTLTFGGGNYTVGNVLSGFTSTVSPNSTGAKIGSFSIQAGVTEAADVRTFAFSIGGSGNATLLSNVKLVDAATGTDIAPAQPGSSTFSFTPTAQFLVAAGQTRTVNLIANVGNQTAATTVIPTMTITGYGATSNQSLIFTNNPLTGTVVNYTNAVTGAPSCTTKLAAQDVLGGGSLPVVCNLNFTSTNGASTINDLTFTLVESNAGAVESVTINGSTVSVVSGTATFSGLNIAVPAGTNGVNMPVAVKFSSAYVGASGAGVATATTATMTLATMKATADGQSPATTSPALVTLNSMTLRATLPTVTKGAAAGTYGVNGSPSGALAVKVGSVTVAADAKGDIIVGSIPVSIAAPGAITAVTLKVGGVIAQDKLSAPVTCTAAATSTCTFTDGYRITANQSVTFDVFATVGATTASGTLETTLGAAASFLWSDDVSTNGSALTGSNLPATRYQQ